MPYRKIVIKNLEKVPVLDKRALKKLIRYYYKGPHDIEITFDSRIASWANHWFDKKTGKHTIMISPVWCNVGQKGWLNRDFEGMTVNDDLTELNDHDKVCKVIISLLHELKHASQCDKKFDRYMFRDLDRHPDITNTYLKYQLSELEAEAEGWALLHFNRALQRYKGWCDDTAH